jgi:very-short-patch-repair endonuclease
MVESLLEVIVVRAVRAGRVAAPARQHPMTVDGRAIRLDLAWPLERVFVEADGFGAHSSRTQFRRDRERQNALIVLGWLPLRYTWPVARTQPERVVTELATVLAARRTSPSRGQAS